jgi:hypothetical protein
MRLLRESTILNVVALGFVAKLRAQLCTLCENAGKCPPEKLMELKVLYVRRKVYSSPHPNRTSTREGVRCTLKSIRSTVVGSGRARE